MINKYGMMISVIAALAAPAVGYSQDIDPVRLWCPPDCRCPPHCKAPGGLWDYTPPGGLWDYRGELWDYKPKTLRKLWNYRGGLWDYKAKPLGSELWEAPTKRQ